MPFGLALFSKKRMLLSERKFLAEHKLCFACLNGILASVIARRQRNVQNRTEYTHYFLLHGAERIFPPTRKKHQLNPMSVKRNILNMFPLLPLWGAKIAKNYRNYCCQLQQLVYLLIAPSVKTLALCDGASTHS